MSTSSAPTLKLGELIPGQEAACFAVLESVSLSDPERKTPNRCIFKDRYTRLPAVIWSSDALANHIESWTIGEPYRIRVKMERTDRYGEQLKLLDIRPVQPADQAHGYNPDELVESSLFNPRERLDALRTFAQMIQDESFRNLVLLLIDQNQQALLTHPAAKAMHHAYRGGFIEHVASVTRLCVFLADHYSRYYGTQLFTQAMQDVLIAGGILHDIGKLVELEQRGLVTDYSTPGILIGHVAIGRDMIRDAARQLGNVCPERLLRLEHAVLAHHGNREFGAPVEPHTPEALLLHYADELDAKTNSVFEAIRETPDTDLFTDRIHACGGRRFFKGNHPEIFPSPPELPCPAHNPLGTSDPAPTVLE
jgi:3'-5' exoribonuclease